MEQAQVDKRRLNDELDAHEGLYTFDLLLDMEKFYDTINPLHLVRSITHRGFPARNAALSLLFHYGPSRLRANGCLSKCYTPATSIRAGCKHAQGYTRCVFYDVLEHMHRIIKRPIMPSYLFRDFQCA